MSKRAGRPEKRVSLNESLHPMPLEIPNLHGRGQVPKERIAAWREHHGDDCAGVIAGATWKGSWLDMAHSGDARLEGEWPGGVTWLLDCVAGQLQHRAGQRRGSQLARHVAHHDAHAPQRQHCGSCREGDEAGATAEGHCERPGVAEKPGRCSIPWCLRDQAHMDRRRAVPLRDEGREGLIGAQFGGEEGDEAARQIRLRVGAKSELDHRGPIADKGDGAPEGWGIHDALQRLAPQLSRAGCSHLRLMLLLGLLHGLMLHGLLLLQRLPRRLQLSLLVLLLLLLLLRRRRGRLAPYISKLKTRGCRHRAGHALWGAHSWLPSP